MNDQIKEFREYRQQMNDRLLGTKNKVIQRIYSLDTLTYQDGALDA